jgi:hypothetical protein
MVGFAVVGGSMLYYVGEEDFVAFYAILREHSGKVFAGSAHKRPARLVLLCAGVLPNQHNFRVEWALAGYTMLCTHPEPASPAPIDLAAYFFHIQKAVAL